MTDLDRLIATIEAGRSARSEPWTVFHASGIPAKYWMDVDAADAGFIDAALRVHDALLPGWGWKLETHKDLSFAWVGAPDSMLFQDYKASFGNPARAWLLAILRALRAREAA